MLEELVSTLGNSATTALIGPFVVLLICGLGLPVPEDIVLIAAGILGAREHIPFLPVAVLMYFGIILGDSIVFLLGKKIGMRVLKTRIGERFIGQKSVDRASDYLRRWGSPIILAARFMPGLRSPIFFTAGMLGFSFYRFALLDSIAAIASAPFFVYLGYWGFRRFQENFSELENILDQYQPILFSVLIAVGIIGGAIYVLRKKRLHPKGPQHEKT